MPQQGISFAGQYFSLPGVYYADNVNTLAQAPPPTTPPLLFIGYGWGPPPKVPQYFTNPNNLTAALRGAPAAAFVPFMAAPSPSLNGAQQITFIDASTNTQATAGVFVSGVVTQTLLTSALYGPPSNQLSVTIANGTTAGRKVTLNDGFAQSVLVGDNLTVPMLLAYSGQATGGVSYTMTTGATSGIFSISSPIAGESISIPVGAGSYSTTALLSQVLNGTATYYSQLLSSTQGLLPANLLSPASAVALPIPTAGALNYVAVNAYINDIAFWVNNFASTMASAVVSGSAVDSALWLPATGSATFFSGARGIPPTNADYAAALLAGLGVPAWTVFCDSNAAGVQALLTAHVQMAGNPPYSSWRRGFTGSSPGDSISAAQTASTNLNAYQMNYVYPGIYRINTTTNLPQLYGGLYAAAAAAAMATGNPIAQPLTNKPLSATGIENANAGQPLNPSQIAALQNSGIMVVYAPQQTGVPTILSDVTTWEDDNNPANTSSQQVACRFWVAYSMVAGLQQYVGSIASPIVELVILNAAKRILNSLVYTGGASTGVLASWVPASLILVFTGSNQLAAISFQATLVSQNRYITVYDTISPTNFSIQLAT